MGNERLHLPILAEDDACDDYSSVYLLARLRITKSLPKYRIAGPEVLKQR